MKLAHHNKQANAGITLVELMVALAVSAILLLGVGTVYNASQRSYQINSQVSELQENARFALHKLTNSIRMAGYTGCNKIDDFSLNVISQNPPPGFDNGDNTKAILPSSFGVNTYITGHTDTGGGNWSPPFEAGLDPSADIVKGTDAITVRGAGACSADVIRETANGKGLQVQGNCNFKQGDVVIVTDCRSADMFTITNNPGNSNQPTLEHDDNGGLNRQSNLTSSYVADAQVFKATAVVYFIGTDHDPVNPSVGLWARELKNVANAYTPQTSVLIPNVEDMSVTYQLDTDGDTARGIDTDVLYANEVDTPAMTTAIGTALAKEDRIGLGDTPWSRVMRINLQLLFRSEPVGTTVRSFSFDGTNYNDTRSRRVFTTAVNIRSRTP